MKRFEIFFGIIKVPMDFIMTVLAFIAAYQLRLVTEPIKGIALPIDYSVLPTIKEYLNFSVLAAITLFVIFAFRRMYSLKSTSKFSRETQRAFVSWLIWAMAMITFFFFTRTFPFSRLAILYSWTLTLLFILFGRAIIRAIQIRLLKKGIGRRRLIFIGNNNTSAEIRAKLSLNPSYKILGVIGKTNSKTDLTVLGEISDLEKIIKNRRADEIIQTESHLPEEQHEKILEFCELNHINYRFVPDLLDVKRSNITTETIAGIPVIGLKPTPLDGWGKVVKRIVDIFGSTLALIILGPTVMLITAIAIKLDSKGPILFTKLDNGKPVMRIGQKGQAFKFYKFRSMQPNTHNLRYTKLAENNTRKGSPLVKIADDPRVTKVGKFIRRYSIDELPQFWNVLIGNISLVGPRPHLPEEVAKYERHHHFVFNIKPGFTGISQVSGRSNLDFEQEAKLDRFYIENWSIWLDLKIIFKTIGVILRGHKE